MILNFVASKDFANESPVRVVEGVTDTPSCTYWDTVTSVTAVAYKRKKVVTSTVFPSGSISTSGKTATLKPMTSLTYGSYVVAVTGTVGGNVVVKKFQVNVAKDEDEQ